MNTTALIAAIIASVLMSITVSYSNTKKNRWIRYAVAIAGVSLALIAIAYVPTLLGDTSPHTAAKAGEYLAYLIVAFIAIKTIFFRK